MHSPKKAQNKLPPKISMYQSLTVNNVLDLFFIILLSSVSYAKKSA